MLTPVNGTVEQRLPVIHEAQPSKKQKVDIDNRYITVFITLLSPLPSLAECSPCKGDQLPSSSSGALTVLLTFFFFFFNSDSQYRGDGSPVRLIF